MLHTKEDISILIIEDDPVSQLVLYQQLINTNLSIAEITIAETLTEGINHLNTKNLSLIFLDLFFA